MEKMKRFLRLPAVLTIIIVLLLAFSVGVSIYLFAQNTRLQTALKSQTNGSKDQTKKLLEKLGRMMELPAGEEPTIATVTDIEKLKDQPFFAKAKNGDMVVIYTNAKKAILFDPATGKIRDVAPLSINPAPTVQPTTTTVALYNGTTKVGITKSAESLIQSKFPTLGVLVKSNAKKTAYPTTLVIDLSGKKQSEAQALATTFNGKLTSVLPPGEEKPATGSGQIDILLILGRDYADKQP